MSIEPPSKAGLIRDDDSKKKGRRMSKEKKEAVYHLCVFVFLDILAVLGLYATVTAFIFHNEFIIQFLPISLFILAFLGAVGVIGAIFLTINILELIQDIIYLD